jgi:hypothetical protein
MRLTPRRRFLPAIVGGGLAAVSVIAGTCLAVLSAGPGPAAAPLNRGSAGIQARGASSAQWAAGVSGGGAIALSLPGPNVMITGQTQQSADNSKKASGIAGSGTAGGGSGAGMPRLVVPDVIAAVPGGVTASDLARIRRLSQVRAVLAITGARITVGGKSLTVLGATASALRPWTPPATAASQDMWSDFAKGDLITTTAAARNLRPGAAYPVSAAVRTELTFGTQALLGVAGVDGIVNETQARKLGLVRNVAVLINAPAANMLTLVGQVRQALGAASQVVRLVPVTVGTSLPVDNHVPSGKPASYLALYQESAAKYCSGLSWTVLAAIGQIESGNGVNVGPSSAGALGPMQFLPSTWQIWGITAFGETGTPNIMDPFDAVPSAARMLCADGAASGGSGLRQAIFDYNHATWYVDEVLALANEYAAEFGG